MSVRKRIAPADDPDLALIKGVAMDIGKEVVAYVERMYPGAIEHTSSTFRLSLRNCVYNEIMAAMKVTDEKEVLARLVRRKAERRELKALVRKIQETDWDHARARDQAMKERS